MKKLSLRVLSVLFILMLVIPLTVATIFAADSGTTGEETGSITPGYTSTNRIWGEARGSANTSFVIKLYSDDTLLATSSLNDVNGIINGDVYVTWIIPFAGSTDEYWDVKWINKVTVNTQPTKVVICVDGVDVATNDVRLNGPDDLDKIYAATTIANGDVVAYHQTLADAIAADPAHVVLVRDITMTGALDATDVVIDLNGHTLTLADNANNNFFGNSTIKNGTISIDGVEVGGDCIIGIGDRSTPSTLNLVDVNLVGSNYSSAFAVLMVYTDGTLNVTGGEWNLSNELGMSGGVIKNQNGAGNNGNVNITGTEMVFNDVSRGISGSTAVLDKVNLTITGGDNGINGAALTVKNSTLNISGGTGRALTVTGNDVVIESSTLNFSDNTEADIRFKTGNALTIDEKSTLSECTVLADSEGATINDTALTAGEEAKGTVSVLDGSIAVAQPVIGLKGTGTAEDPYLINNKAELEWFRDQVNAGNTYAGKYVKLTADIDLNNEAWTPIGTESNPFKGNFNGNDKTISNLTVSVTGDNAGLFGKMADAYVGNLTIKNATVTGEANVGAAVGNAYTGKVENVKVTGTIDVNGNYKVGGIAGSGYASFVNCSVEGAEGSKITGTYTAVSDREGDAVGGIVGFHGEGSISIKDCSVSRVTVTGTRKVGGVVGSAFQDNIITGVTVKNVTVGTNATADYANANAKTMGIGGVVGLYTANGTPSTLNATVENITLTNADNVTVSAGYITGGLRGTETPVAPTVTYKNVTLIGNNTGATANFVSYNVEVKGKNILSTDIQGAVDAASAGDVIIINSNISDEAVVVDKSVTITGDVTLDNVSITGDGAEVNLTVSNLKFTGTSYINANNIAALTVTGVEADVTLNGADAVTNSRAAFISLGASELTTPLLITITDNNIVVKGNAYPDPILGWRYIAGGSEISGNTFGSEETPHWDAVKLMNVMDGATLTISGNTVYTYGTSGNGFAFGQNCSRNNAYTVVIDGNTFYGDVDYVWIEVSGASTTHATVQATSGNKIVVDGVERAFTAADIKASSRITTWTSYAGVDVELDENGKVIGGTLKFYGEDAIADGFATDEDGKVVAVVAEVDGKYYETLAEAIAAAGENDTVTLLADVAITKTLEIAADKTITLDLNGYTLSCNTQYTSVITNNGKLTVEDSSEAKTGTVKAIGGVNSGVIINNVGATAILNGGNFIAERTTISNDWMDNYYTIVNHGTMTINEGVTVSCNSNSGSALIENGWQNGAENTTMAPSVLTINGGKISGGTYNVKVDDYGELTVNGGEFNNEGSCNILVWNKATINGGTFISTKYGIWGGQGSTEYIAGLVTVTGGDFTQTATAIVANRPFNVETSITGGTYDDESVKAYLAEGYIINAEGKADGPYAAAIGTTGYKTLADAFAAAKKGDVVELLTDITVSEQITINDNDLLSDITLDGNGKTIYDAVSGASTICFGSNGYWPTGVKINDLKVQAAEGNDNPYCAIRFYGGASSVLTNVDIIGNYTYGINFYGTHGATLTNCNIVSAFTNGQATYALKLVNSTITTLIANDGATMEPKIFLDETSSITTLYADDHTAMIDPNSLERIGTILEADTEAPMVAKIGDVLFGTLQAAVNVAKDGDTITVIGNISDEAVTVTKSVTITADEDNKPILKNVSITGAADELTVSNLKFTGNSWINSGKAKSLTVSGVEANVVPVNTTATNSRSAFIALGNSEQITLVLTIENSNIVVGETGIDGVLGWAQIKEATIKGNTFGSENAYFASADAVKFMSIANDAVINVTGNTVYSNYNGIVFYQNTTRDNAYTVNVDNNDFYGTADHIWVEVGGTTTTHATIKATRSNTVNGEVFTAADIKASRKITAWTSYAGVDVELDGNGKVIGGTLAFYGEDAIADGFMAKEDGTVVTVAAEVNGTAYETLAEAVAAAKNSTITLMQDVTLADSAIVLPEGATLDLNGYTLTLNAFIAFNGSYIVDSSDGDTGLLVVPEDRIVLAADNPELPVWNGTAYEIKKINLLNKFETTENGFVVKYRPGFGDAETNTKYFGDGAEDNKITFVVHLSWTDADGNLVYEEFEISESLVKTAYTDNKQFEITVKVPSTIDKITVTGMIISESGVELTESIGTFARTTTTEA